jgi:hypothetical protein
MDLIKVEKGKLNGGYKLIEGFEPRYCKRAWALYFGIKLEPGEKKRIRQGSRTLKQLSCYYT